MQIEYVKGNILESDADYIVCPVNCVGTMGAGLAKQMKMAWPSLDDDYQLRLRTGELNVMKPYTVSSVIGKTNGGGVILFPTKFHYKDNSEVGNIASNLYRIDFWKPFGKSLNDRVTIAFPKLGCGLGGLKWHQVKPHMEHFARFNEHQVKTIVYE